MKYQIDDINLKAIYIPEIGNMAQYSHGYDSMIQVRILDTRVRPNGDLQIKIDPIIENSWRNGREFCFSSKPSDVFQRQLTRHELIDIINRLNGA